MRLDDLTRELQAQAEETRSWPMPGMDVPSRRRVVHHPGRTLAVVLASVAAVVLALVTVPRLVEQSRPSTPRAGIPTPTPTVAAEPGIREWRALRCPSRTARTCSVPWLMTAAGQEYSTRTGARQPVHNRSGISRTVSVDLGRQAGGRLVMVGATHPGPGSELVVRVGEGKSVRLARGLTLLPLPASSRSLEVSITEHGEPALRETLVIEEYVPVRQKEL